MRGSLHFAMGKPLGVSLVRAIFLVEYKRSVDGEVVKLHVLGLAGNLHRFFLYTVEVTVLHGNVAYVLYLVSTNDEHAIVALLASYIFYAYILYGRFESAVADFLWLVVEIDFYYSFLALTYCNLAHVDVLDYSTTTVVGFDAENAFQMR